MSGKEKGMDSWFNRVITSTLAKMLPTAVSSMFGQLVNMKIASTNSDASGIDRSCLQSLALKNSMLNGSSVND